MPRYTPDEAIYVQGPWTHRDVSANGARFHIVTAGTGPTVLLLHGFPTYWWTWRLLMPQLAAAGYRVVAMDLRGYGGSDHPPRGYDMYSLSHDVAGVIRSLGERNATVIGHGIGGMLAWTTAALQPDVVSRLAAISVPHPVRMRESILGDRAQLQASGYILAFQRPWIPERQLVADNAQRIEAFLRSWAANPAWPDDDVSDHYRAAFQMGNTAHCAIEYHRWALRSIPRPDGRRFASDMAGNPIDVPILHLHGAADRTVLPRSSQGSRRFALGPYAWRTIPGAGHFPHEEVPEITNQLILDWLAADTPWDDPHSSEIAAQ
ncbi:MAG: alpha/beta fold hydrolase [Candidatus Nanopelagicales bacterium]